MLFDIVLIWQLFQFFCTHRDQLFWQAGRKILHEDWQHCSPLEAGGAWAEQVGGAVLSVIIQQVGGAARRRRQAGLPIFRLLRGVPEPQSQDRYHRVATAAFWRTFNHEGKISPGWWGWGVHGRPLSLQLPSPVRLQCTLQLSGQTH